MGKESARQYLNAGLISLWSMPFFKGAPTYALGALFILCLVYTLQLWKEEDCKHNYKHKEYKLFRWIIWSGQSCTKCTHQIGQANEWKA